MVYQVTASLLGVEEKRKQFASLSADELRSALKAAPIPVVLGFETHFVIDHRRLGRALSDGQHISQRLLRYPSCQSCDA
jgi:hypothetical protein